MKRRSSSAVGVSDVVGAELLELSRDNFRQKLARARRDLQNFMQDKCGLVNTANPCRKAETCVEGGTAEAAGKAGRKAR